MSKFFVQFSFHILSQTYDLLANIKENMEHPQKMPKVTKVKAEVKITAEQLLREAKERDFPPPPQIKSDAAELADYQQRNRKTFEDNLRKNRMVVNTDITLCIL